jgi:aminopeptidase YwaD
VTAAALASAGVDVRALAAPGEADARPHSRALGVRARVEVEVEHERAETANVVALLPGRDPALAAECVVVGAHHDHLGLGGDASLAPEQTGAVHPGADDNASGVAALLALARAFAAEGPARRTVVFAAFGAEELGLLGSAQLVKDPPARCPVERMQLMVNLDMVGRPRGGKVYVDGADTAKGLRRLVSALAEQPPRLPLQLAFGGDGYGPSDHTSFHARGVPVLFLFTGAHADYHRPSDTAEKVDGEGLARVAQLAHRAAREAAERDRRLEVVRTAGPPPQQGTGERGYGSYLGAIPDFAERTEPGVLLTGVRPGSPAERAGVAAGDVLLRVGASKVMNLQDLAFALRSHRPGDEVVVEWARGAERRTATVKLEERRSR